MKRPSYTLLREEERRMAVVEEEPRTIVEVPKDRQGVIKGPSILTSQKGNGRGVLCTSATDEEHTSVRNRLPVHGKISLLQDLHNEI